MIAQDEAQRSPGLEGEKSSESRSDGRPLTHSLPGLRICLLPGNFHPQFFRNPLSYLFRQLVVQTARA